MSLFCSPFSDHCDRLQIQDFAGCGSQVAEGISHTCPNSHRWGTPERSMAFRAPIQLTFPNSLHQPDAMQPFLTYFAAEIRS